jgi:hypothetical protein
MMRTVLCFPLIQGYALQLSINTTQDVEGGINGFSVPSMSSVNRARDYAAPNPSGECCKADTAIGCRLLAR